MRCSTNFGHRLCRAARAGPRKRRLKVLSLLGPWPSSRSTSASINRLIMSSARRARFSATSASQQAADFSGPRYPTGSCNPRSSQCGICWIAHHATRRRSLSATAALLLTGLTPYACVVSIWPSRRSAIARRSWPSSPNALWLHVSSGRPLNDYRSNVHLTALPRGGEDIPTW